jgi:ketosteroid isomerase-like protein
VRGLAAQPRFADDADAYWRGLAENEYHVYDVLHVVEGAGAPDAAGDAATLAAARRAFAAFRAGHRTGDWAAFLAALTDDVVLWLPGGPVRGAERRPGARRGLRPVLERRPRHGDAVLRPVPDDRRRRHRGVRGRGRGHAGGRAGRNRIVMAFDVRGGRVSAIREYLGVLPDARPAAGGG